VLAYNPGVALIILLFFIIIVAITRYVSLASISSAVLLIIILIFTGTEPFLLLCFVALSSLVIFKHRKNITRLRAGTESKIKFKKT